MSKKGEVCPNCQSVGTIELDQWTGQRVCKECSSIIQESAIVNEQSFVEMSNGTTKATGTFVYHPSGFDVHGVSSSSLTLAEGRGRIEAICDELTRLPPEVNEFALKIFTSALRERFTRGRTIEIVAGASVYVAIRAKKTTGYFLVDVADHVDCGVYELAATALSLAEVTGVFMPSIDPTLYINRFTDALNFGRQSVPIHDTALKIIRRMERDWIQTGRKPAGICGAAIMIAAKIHHVDISKDKIMEIARVCSATINKRLTEISRTELAKNSIENLRTNEAILEEESQELPPILKLRMEIKKVAETIEPVKHEVLKDNFSDEELHDVDNLIINEDEADRKAAVFYAMYKSKINQPPKEQKPKKPKKQKPIIHRKSIDELNIDIGSGDIVIMGDDDDGNEAEAESDFEVMDFD